MQCIICGSRTIADYGIVKAAIDDSEFNIIEVVSGGAVGPDRLGERWAKENGILVTRFLPDWNKYGKRAGMLRNAAMIDYIKPNGAVIAVWDGVSRGTANTILLAKRSLLKLFVKEIKCHTI